MNDENFYYRVIPETGIPENKIKLFKRCCEICRKYFPGAVLPSDFEVKWVRKTTRAYYANSEEPYHKIVDGLRRLFPNSGIEPLEDRHVLRNKGGEYQGMFKTSLKRDMKGEPKEIKMFIFLREDQTYRDLADTILHELYHMIQFIKNGRGVCAVDLAGHFEAERGAVEFVKKHLFKI